jgi:hypothetical protein
MNEAEIGASVAVNFLCILNFKIFVFIFIFNTYRISRVIHSLVLVIDKYR